MSNKSETSLTNIDFLEITNNSFQKINNQHIFYKYIDFETGVEKIIKSLTLKFSKPEDFNDPFDCNEELLIINLNKELIKAYEFPSELLLSRGEKRAIIRKAQNESASHTVLKNKKKKFKICCFSQKYDDVLMWSHYGNKHTGIVIGFDLPIVCTEYVVHPVTYISEIKAIDGLVDTSKVFNYWLTHKSACWSYENEFRAISVDQPEIISFEKSRIKEIIFGCRVKESDRKQVKAIMNKLGYSGVIFKALTIDKSTYSLKGEILD